MTTTMTRRRNEEHVPSSIYREICPDCEGRGHFPPLTMGGDTQDCHLCQCLGERCTFCHEPVINEATHGCEDAADPADVMAIEGYYANTGHRVDGVWTRKGVTYYALSWKSAPDLSPHDQEVYAWAIAERNVEGADVDVIAPRLVGTVDGMTGRTTWEDDDEQAYEERS